MSLLSTQGGFLVNMKLFLTPRRLVLVLATAFLLATTAASASVWLDNLTGTALTPTAYACQPIGTGCG